MARFSAGEASKKTPLNRAEEGETMVAEATIVFAFFAVGKHFAQSPSSLVTILLGSGGGISTKEINFASDGVYQGDQN